MQRIEIRSSVVPANEFFTHLEKEISGSADVKLKFIENDARMDPPDPVILSAIAGGLGAGLTTLITGILKIFEARAANTGVIVIVGEGGARVEVPAGTSQDDIKKLVDQAARLAKPKIFVE